MTLTALWGLAVGLLVVVAVVGLAVGLLVVVVVVQSTQMGFEVVVVVVVGLSVLALLKQELFCLCKKINVT